MRYAKVVLSRDTKEGRKIIGDLTARNRMYQTVVATPGASDGEFETFITTSKDIHLRLGQMTEEGREALAKLIRQHLHPREDGVELLHIHLDGDDGRILVATLVAGPSDMIHLAPG